MFIDSMTGSELMKEYRTDYPSLIEYAMKLNCSEEVAKIFKKGSKGNLISVWRPFTSQRKNRYLTLLLYEKREGVACNDWSVTSVFVGIMRTHKGDAIVGFFEETGQAMAFTPHFFKRYKERLLESCDWKTRNKLLAAKTTKDIAPLYLVRNQGMVWMNAQSTFGNKSHIFSPVDDGVALMQWDSSKQRLQANTFLTYDMLNAKQNAMVEYAKEYMNLPIEERAKYDFSDFVSNDKSSFNQQTQSTQ